VLLRCLNKTPPRAASLDCAANSGMAITLEIVPADQIQTVVESGVAWFRRHSPYGTQMFFTWVA
jgi:hypothetical protein